MSARTRLTIATLAVSILGIGLVASGGPAAAAGPGDYPEPPETTIRYGPEGWTNLTRPLYGYESDNPLAQFECRLDSGPFVACGPATYEVLEGHRGATLSDGEHTIEVRAVGPGEEADPTPARAVIFVDTHPPTAAIVSGLTHRRRPKFTLRVAGEDSFSCRIVGKNVRIVVRSCDGPTSFRPPRPLPEGAYDLNLSARDQAGNEADDQVEFSVRTKPGPPPPPLPAPNPYRGSTLYSGRGEGVRVHFRLKGRRLIEARVVSVAACVTELNGRRWFHHRRLVREDASPRWPIRVDGRGNFRAYEGEPSASVDSLERLVGHVTPRSIVGRTAISFSEKASESPDSETCQTGPRRPGSMRELTFRAHRHS
jgi:hypothetical protein